MCTVTAHVIFFLSNPVRGNIKRELLFPMGLDLQQRCGLRCTLFCSNDYTYKGNCMLLENGWREVDDSLRVNFRALNT